jgi:prepilin signal peptidase PulO-like enzyme (type II secretory pathway)
MLIIISIFVFIFGLIIGSFLNCLIWRTYKEESLMGRSYCPTCRKQIRWYDNIPLLSYIMLKGKCRHCGKKISWQYPIVELITGILFILAFLFEIGFNDIGGIFNFQFSIFNYLRLIRDWLIIAVMIVIFVIDLRWFLILDIITLPSAIIFLAINIYLGFNWQNLLISGIIGSSFFLIQFIISSGKWIGGGDIRLGLLIGFIFGWPKVILAVLLAYMIGSIIGIGLIMAGKKNWGSKLPLGVFLSLSSLLTLFYGDEILSWYLKFIGF